MNDLIAAARQALEALEDADGIYIETECVTIDVGDEITALRTAIEAAEKQQALDKKAENARELGLDYEPVAQPQFVLNGIDCSCGRKWRITNNTLTVSESAPAAPVQEPFCWAQCTTAGLYVSNEPDKYYTMPLYTAQPTQEFVCSTGLCHYKPAAQRQWVGLTQQDIDVAFDDTQEGGGFDEFARAIEQRLKEKNT